MAKCGKRYGEMRQTARQKGQTRRSTPTLRTWMWQPTIGATANVAPCTGEYRGEWALQATPLRRWRSSQNAANITAKYGKPHGKTGQTRRSAPTHVNVTVTANVAPHTGKKKSAKLRPSHKPSMNAHSMEVTPLACASGGG